MCELLLIVANRKVGIDLSWKALQDRAKASASFVLMSSGGIWAYRYRKSLYYLVRKPPHEAEATLISKKGYKAKLSLKKYPKDMVTLLTTEKLTDENWKLLPDKTLVEVTHKGAQAAA